MDLVANGVQMTRETMQAEMAAMDRAATMPQQLQPLQIDVPSSGIHYAFEKLYANQAEEDASFSIPYTSDFGAAFGQAIALLGAALFWTGLWLAWRRSGPVTGRRALALAGGGLTLLLIPIGYLQTSVTPPLLLSAAVLLGALATLTRERLSLLPGRGPATG
jgi:hypothetical protein